MSLVGNIPSNHDRGVISEGVPGPEMAARRPSQYEAEERQHTAASESDASTIAANAESTSQIQRPHLKESQRRQSVASIADVEETARRERQVLHLARRLTAQSQGELGNQNPFNAPHNSELDPNGDNFNARAWTKAMLHLQQEDVHAAPTRTAGVSFKNLNVHGFGTDADYQKSVGNVWLEGPALAKQLMGNKGCKIDILQNLDGLVEAGEMLVVLGKCTNVGLVKRRLTLV